MNLKISQFDFKRSKLILYFGIEEVYNMKFIVREKEGERAVREK